MMDLTQNSKPETDNPHLPAIEILHQKVEMILSKELRELEMNPSPQHQVRAAALRHKLDSIKKTITHLQTQGGNV